MKQLLAAIVLLSCLAADGRADFNAIDLSTMCASNNPAVRDQCTAWIIGFQAGIGAQQRYNTSVCLPKDFTGAEAIPIIEKYMNEHPDELQHNAEHISFFALWKAFPCAK